MAALVAAMLGVIATPPAAAGPVDDAPPATIRVCRSSGEVDVVPFKEYVKVVLPVEFPADWPVEVLRAGAVAIKSYAWFHVRYPASDRCDLGDTTRYQLYDPSKQRRTAVSDRAVEETWHLRLDDTSRGDVAYAQYCSRGCETHRRYAGEGRYLDQDEALDRASEGWTHQRLLEHYYRNLPVRLWSWTAPFGLASNEDVVNLDDPPARLVLGVSGVAPGDGRARAAAHAVCTLDGQHGRHLLQSVPVTASGDGTPIVAFDALGGLAACEDQEAAVVVDLVVNAHIAAQRAVPAWRHWRSDVTREVERVAPTADPIAGSVAVSRDVFASVSSEQPPPDAGQMVAGVMGDQEPRREPRRATSAVLARADAFPDALGATALAGTDSPILLTTPGPDAPLATGVRDEITRILEPGAEVRIVGGTNAVSQRAEDELTELGYEVVRVAGPDRVATALAIADLLAEGGTTPRVLLVRGFPNGTAGWADAVAVGPWAARTGTPILVTPDTSFAPEVEAWIEDPAHGVEEVLVIGGTRAVPATVEAQLDGVDVVRLRGARRDATALLVADQLWGSRGTPPARHVVVADVYGPGGWAFAVTGAVPAAIGDAATITVADLVPPTTVGAWFDARPELGATIIGGPTVVSDDVHDALVGPAADDGDGSQAGVDPSDGGLA